MNEILKKAKELVELFREAGENQIDWYWTCTSWSTKERGWSSVAVVSSSGYVDYYDCNFGFGVRPVCILKSNLFVSKVEE